MSEKFIERDTPMKGNYNEPRICTMVGRDPNNPSSRARSEHYEQMLELGDDVSNTLTSVQKDNLVAEPKLIEVGNLVPQTGKWKSPQRGSVFSTEGIGPSLDTCSGGGRETKILQRAHGSIIIDDYNQRVPQNQDVIGTVTTLFGNPAPRYGFKIVEPKIEESSYRIRKLTPRECFRLMGVTETDIDRIQESGVSQSQQYKMAGNSIVVDCLYHLFRKMFVETESEDRQLTLF